MNLLSRIKHEWRSAGVIERASWFIEFGVPVMGGIVWFYGLIMQSNIFILLSIIFFLLAFVVISLNISMRHERDAIRRTYDEEHSRFEKKIEDCRGHHAKLLKRLGEENNKKQRERMAAKYGGAGQIRSTFYNMDALFDITTPDDILFNEETGWAKNADEKETH
jgi:hypothetical protein